MAHHTPHERASNPTPDLREQASRVREDVGELARLAREAARDEIMRWKEGASGVIESGKERATQLNERLGEKVVDRPLTSLAIAAAAGVLIGLFMSRR